MPYRRLPKTDQARLRALKALIDSAAPLSFELRQRVKMAEPGFENCVAQMSFFSIGRIDASRREATAERQARTYLAGFLAVLIAAVNRGDIRRKKLQLYGLDEQTSVVPSLEQGREIIRIGEAVIRGEQARIMEGGVAINFPTIQKVRVFYDIYSEARRERELSLRNEARQREVLRRQRVETDALLLEAWDAVEAAYADLRPFARLTACQAAGLIYYYRTGEHKLTELTDARLAEAEAEVLTENTEPEPKPEPKSKPKAETKPETKSETKSEPEPERAKPRIIEQSLFE